MPNDPVTVSISSQSGFHPEEIARHSFPSARKGLDPDAVRRYLESLASEMQLVLDREQSVRRRLAELERAVAEPPEVDQQTILRAVGSETTKILETAHQAAADVVSRAESEAGEILTRADSVLEERTAAAEEEAGAILEEARVEAEALSAEAQEDAVALLEATRAECRRVIREARELRASLLDDLTERRRELRVQLEQLRGGRDSLLEMLDAVGEAVDEARERLVNAEHDARVAAAEAGDRAELLPDEEIDDSGGERLRELEVESLGPPTEDDVLEPRDEGEGVRLLTDEALAGELYDEEAGGGEPSEERSRRSVDELFARIRAGRADEAPEGAAGTEPQSAEEGAEGVLGQHSAHEAAVLEADDDAHARGVEVGEGDGETRETAPAEAGPTAALEEAEAALHEEAEESSPGGGAGDEEEAAAGMAGEDAEHFARRSSLLDPLTDGLSRALKRALRDDQNVLLDALRNATSSSELDSLLPESDQRARIEEAAAPLLAKAWGAGHSFLGGSEPAEKEPGAAGERLATDLADELSSLVRARLTHALETSSESGEGAAEAAGAAFREWRGSRIESVAADFSVRAFSDGVVIGGNGQLVRWVVDDEGRPCPDCDDNALAGPLGAGEEFPTGQVHPPVHPGCRCLLVAVTS